MRKGFIPFLIFAIPLVTVIITADIVGGDEPQPTNPAGNSDTLINEGGNEQASKIESALASAEESLHRIDEKDYNLDGYSTMFKTAITQEAWNKDLEAFRAPLGEVKSRNVKSKSYFTTMPGAPDGEYVVIKFETMFENKENAVETITLMLEGDQSSDWKIAGYYIN
jgi:hypothetical protein